MDHAEAVQLNAVERYLLGEFDPAQRDAFENHYFGCVECAGEVKATAAFIDNVREAMRLVANPSPTAPSLRPQRAGWLGWLRPAYALGAVAVLAIVVGYQNFVTIPQMRHGSQAAVAQALPTLSLVAVSRGAGNTGEITVPPASSFGVFVDIPAGSFASYSCEIRSAAGARKLAINVTAAQAKDAVELLVPGSTLDAGRYEVVILGSKAAGVAPSEEVARYAFDLKLVPGN